jgi:hypothetical protein
MKTKPKPTSWRQLLKLPHDEISQRLRAEWRDLETPSVIKLAALIGKSAPMQVEPTVRGDVLVLKHTRQQKVAAGSGLSPEDFEPEETFLFLSQPIALARVTAAFGALKLKPSKAAVELFVRLGGLVFELPTRKAVFPTKSDDLYAAGDVKKWKGAAIIYTAPNGDRILLSRSGRTAWTQFETDRILPIGTFDEMLNDYRKAATRFRFFDSWWPDAFD